MAEQTEAPPETAAPADPKPTGRVPGRRVAIAGLAVVAGVAGIAQVFGGTVVALGAGGVAAAGAGGYALYRRAKNGKRRSVTRRFTWRRQRTTSGGGLGRRRAGSRGLGGGRGGGRGFHPFRGRKGSGGGAGGGHGRGRLGKMFGRGRGGGSGAGSGGGRRGGLGGLLRRRGGSGAGRRGGGGGGRASRFKMPFRRGGGAGIRRGGGNRRGGSRPGGGLRQRMAGRVRRANGRRSGWSAPFGRGQGGRPLTRRGRPASRARRAWWALTPNAAWRKPKPAGGKPAGGKPGAGKTSRPQRVRQAMRRLVPVRLRRRMDKRRAVKQMGGTKPGLARRALRRMAPKGLRRKPKTPANPLAPKPRRLARVAARLRPRWLTRKQQQGTPPETVPPVAVPQPNFRPASGQQLPGPGIAAGGPKFAPPTAPQPRGGPVTNPAEAIEETATEALSGYTPGSGDELDAFLKQWPDTIEAIAGAANSAAESWGDEHIHPNVIASFQEHAAALRGIADTAREAFESHRKEHALWVE